MKRTTKRKVISIIVLLILIAFYKFNLAEKIIYPFPYKQIVEKYASAYNVDPFLVIAVIREESHFYPKSNSHKGAIGLMQLMPNTAKDIAVWLHENYDDLDLQNPEDNIRYGTWYLSALNREFKGNTMLVLAAYNAGSGRLNSWINSSPGDLNSYRIEDIPFTETKEYVIKVLKSYEQYTKLYNKTK
jgi:soluble lytic murein transglycosylase